MRFSASKVADYYNTTQIHYEKWWGLNKNLSLHYGIWDKHTRSFEESLRNTNQILLDKAQIASSDKVLDAGCGVGGAAIFVHRQTGAKVQGISLSHKQVALAQKMAKQKEMESGIQFHLMDFTQTDFPDASFDVVWACESVCHAENKQAFIQECYRLLKHGGRLVMSDFFITQDGQEDPQDLIQKWGDTWGVPHFASLSSFQQGLQKTGFQQIQSTSYTQKIFKSARRLYHASLLGMIPSNIYNFFHPQVTPFAKNHYKCGIYQYKALKQGLWQYHIIQAVKS